MFLKTLAETSVASGWRVHGFVLMRNHYHLLIEIRRITLVKGMQYLNSTYTRRYNIRHKTFGHLFQGRYKALLIDNEQPGYFLTVSDYIHMNPVRAKKVHDLQSLLKDPWSSVGWLAGSRKGRPDWLSWEKVYGGLGLSSWRSRSRREYRQYLERRIAEIDPKDEQWKKIRRGWCFGTEGFIAKMKDLLEEMADEKPRQKDSWAGAAVEEMEERKALRLLEQGVQVLGYKSIGQIRGRDRYLLGKLIRNQTRVRVPWLAEQFGLKTRGGMSHGITRIGRLLEEDQKLKKQWKLLSQNVA